MSGRSRTVVCPQNVPIADFLCAKREEFRSEKPKLFKTLDNACKSLCDHSTPVRTLHDAKNVKNIGGWILKMLKPFFEGDSANILPEESSSQPEGSNEKGKKSYCPRVRSAAYALLITLLRAHQSGKEFMRKSELIDATDMSGLSERPIRPNVVSWTGGLPNSRDFYSGWNGMKTLTEKCLVVKSSNPGKYKLTDEGRLVAQDCLKRAGLDQDNSSGLGLGREEGTRAVPSGGGNVESRSGREEDLSDDDIQEIPELNFRKRNNAHFANPQNGEEDDILAYASSQRSFSGSVNVRPPDVIRREEASARAANLHQPRDSRPWDQYSRSPDNDHFSEATKMNSVDPEDALTLPPLDAGEKFFNVYDVTCILDQREKFRKRVGNESLVELCRSTLLSQFAESLRTQFKVKVETRMLPVGDALWVARHKHRGEEYVLDFVVERKQVEDFWLSIRDNRYKQQKLRLQNCGLKRLLYLVEGDVNSIESTDALKTAMFTTELQGGFRLLRTADPNATCRQYGHLTLAIISRYNLEVGKAGAPGPVCKTYKNFVEQCRDLAKDRVKDVFCCQLTQISYVTEDVALSIQDRYPTLISLVQAYIELEGNEGAQEKLLQGIPIRNSTRSISAVISKNVYKLVWAS